MIFANRSLGQSENMKLKNALERSSWLTRAPRRGSRLTRLLVVSLTLVGLAGASGCKNKSAKRVPQPVITNAPPPSEPLVTDPLPPPMPPSLPPVEEAPPPPPPEPDKGDESFENGLYQEAALAYEADLQTDASQGGPERLIRLAIAYQLGPEPEAKRDRVVQLLKAAIEAKPDGPLVGVAESMLALLERNRSLQQDSAQKDRRIRQLSEELERLKQIDLRRRPPGS